MSRSIQIIRRRRARPQLKKRGTTTAVFLLLSFLLFTPIFLLGSAALTAVFLPTLFPLPDVAQLETLPQQMQPSATPSEIYSSGSRPQLLDQIIPPAAPWQPLAQLPPAVGEAALVAAGDNGLADVAAALVAQHLLPANPNGNFFTDWLRQRQTQQLQQQLLTRYSREQLLEWYVNGRYYGQLAFGIEAAAQSYLGKTAVFLTLPEAITLAALPSDPTFDAFAHADQLQPRREAIFNALVASGKLDPTTAQLARTTPVALQPQPDHRFNIIAPHFVQQVRQELLRHVTPQQLLVGNLRITTTLDPQLQQQAECVSRIQLARLAGQADATLPPDLRAGCAAAALLPPQNSTSLGHNSQVNGVALVALDPRTAEVRAMVGSADYWDRDVAGAVNLATAVSHKPGTLLQPFIYLTALSQGYSPATMLFDLPPDDSLLPTAASSYLGPLRLRQALASGLPQPARQALTWVGAEKVVRTARNLGLISLTPADASLDLPQQGGRVSLLDLAYSYGVVANNGVMVGQPRPANDDRLFDPVTILRIEASDGTVLYEHQPAQREILSTDLAYLLRDMLADRSARCATLGCPNLLELPNNRPAAVKAGETASGSDLWTIGTTPELLVGVWLGNINGQPTVNETGLTAAAPIWHAVTGWALADAPPTQWPRPATLVEQVVCETSGLLPTPACPQVAELFIPGTQPVAFDSIYREVAVNRENGRLATVYTPPELIERRLFRVYPEAAAAWARANGEPQPPTEFDTIVAQGGENGRFALITPEPFATVSGVVAINGTILSTNFASYRVAIFPGLLPDALTILADNQTDHKTNEPLAVWDTHPLPNGLYTILLTVLNQDGTFSELMRHVTVANE